MRNQSRRTRTDAAMCAGAGLGLVVNAVQIRSFCVLTYEPVDSEGWWRHCGPPFAADCAGSRGSGARCGSVSRHCSAGGRSSTPLTFHSLPTGRCAYPREVNPRPDDCDRRWPEGALMCTSLPVSNWCWWPVRVAARAAALGCFSQVSGCIGPLNPWPRGHRIIALSTGPSVELTV